MEESQLRLWPFLVCSMCKEDSMVPDRIIDTAEESVLFSWIRPGKYAEMEFDDNDNILAWTCYEVDESVTEILNVKTDSMAGQDLELLLRRTLNTIEDFLA